MKHLLRALAVTVAASICLPALVSAQALGTFRWQLLPYCNVVTLSVTAQGGTFALQGFDDQCGAGQRAGVVGTAFPNPDGTIGIGLSTVVTPGGHPLHIDARINAVTLHGPWQDSVRNSGSFVFTPGGGIAGPPRPAPSPSISRVFTLGVADWVAAPIGAEKFRQAVLPFSEITQAVVDNGSIRAFVEVLAYGPGWTELPFLLLNDPTTIAIFASFGPGQVILRSRGSDNGEYAPQARYRIVVTP